MPRIFCGTYGKYSGGSLKGTWIDLEECAGIDAFLEKCRQYHKDEADPEFMFCDFEDIPREFVGECYIKPEFWDYMNCDIDDSVKEAYMYLFDEWNEERCNDTYIGQFRNRAELAESIMVTQGELDDVPEYIARYFDYDAYGRDLELGGDVCEHNDHYFWTNY